MRRDFLIVGKFFIFPTYLPTFSSRLPNFSVHRCCHSQMALAHNQEISFQISTISRVKLNLPMAYECKKVSSISRRDRRRRQKDRIVTFPFDFDIKKVRVLISL